MTNNQQSPNDSSSSKDKTHLESNPYRRVRGNNKSVKNTEETVTSSIQHSHEIEAEDSQDDHPHDIFEQRPPSPPKKKKHTLTYQEPKRRTKPRNIQFKGNERKPRNRENIKGKYPNYDLTAWLNSNEMDDFIELIQPETNENQTFIWPRSFMFKLEHEGIDSNQFLVPGQNSEIGDVFSRGKYS